MKNEKRKRGRPPKIFTAETTGMTYEGTINYALDRQLKSELDKALADKPDSELTDEERKYLDSRRENKTRTLNVYNHLSFTTEENQGGRRERAWAKLRQISDEICREHGLSVVEEPEKGMGVSHYERDMQIEGKSWKEKLRHKLAKAIMKSFSFEDFLRRCKKKGIEVVYEPTHKHKIKYRLEGQQRFVRGETLGEFYTADAIAEQIEIIYKTAEENMRKANAEPAPKPTPTVTAPKIEPITEPKPTITAVPKTEPTAAPSERGGVVYNALLEAMRKRGMELPTTTEPVAPTTAQPTLSIPTPITTEPKSVDTATKPSEKKEDKWEGIRGLRNADAMIAELEAAGVESLDVLRSFFWNAKHKDDHSTELVSLRKQFNAIDTLIAKMKHRDELAPIYKEYQGKTGWSQSRFKKKNADAIEDYEQTVAYIKEHRKPFMVDGKPPTLLDLMDRSNRLKTTYNTLMEEHSRFIAKKTAADKYTKTVRSYLLKKEADRQNAQNRQRDISRKKTYLE